ncbi:MAG: hypothetical protein OHK0013_10910 [Sandaracinaceae bacterium]|jgi:hypothetical protein
MAAHSVSQSAAETRVFNAMKTTNEPLDPPPIAESDSSGRLADLRRRRTELVDVLAETLLERVLRAPRGPRRPSPPRAPGDGVASV